MYEGLSPEVKVNEGGHKPYLTAAQPRPHVLGAVLHVQRDTLSVLEAGGEEEVGDLVAVLVQLKQDNGEYYTHEGRE